MRLQLVFISILTLAGLHLAGQAVTPTSNVMPANATTGTLYVGSGTLATPINKASIGGSLKLFNTGTSGISSPSLYLWNTTATTGRNYYLNTDNLGNFRIIDSNAANAVRFHISGVTTTLGFIGIGNTAPAAKLHITGTGTTNATTPFLVQNSAAAEMFRVLDNGNVGIGIAAPAQKLDVAGMIKSSMGFTYGSTIGGTWDITGTFSRYLATATTDGIEIATAKTPSYIRFRVNNGARGIQLDGGSANFLFMGGSGETLSGIGNVNGTGNLAFLYSTAGNSQTEGMRLTTAGNVGIGTATPGSLLEVSGNNSPTAAVKTTGTTLAQMLVGDGANSFGLQYYPAGNCCWPAGTSVMTTGSSPGNLVFYTPNPLQFYIGGSERARFSATGNFGLGNSSPTEKLDVTGNVKFSGALMPNNTAGTAGQVLTSAGAGLAPTWAAASGGSSQWTTSAPHIYFNTGNVGIGTITPAYKLDVNGTLKVDGTAASQVQFTGTNSFNPGFTFDGSTSNTHTYTFDSQNFSTTTAQNTKISGGLLQFINNAAIQAFQQPITITRAWPGAGTANTLILDNDIQNAVPATYRIASFRLSGTEKAWIDQTGGAWFEGSVGIGVTNTSDVDYKLFVDKGIKTRKVKVTQTAWPDYVFHKQYKLPSLTEVEKFIKANNHLPEVPSAKEIETDGLNLGDNQAVLLKKIEELTLYIIDLNKKSEEQNKKIAELEKKDSEMKEIKKQLEDLKNMILKK
jgi:hypothetical protein